MADAEHWVIIEHRRQLIGGTQHNQYGSYPSEDAAYKAAHELQNSAEFGVTYTVEHRT